MKSDSSWVDLTQRLNSRTPVFPGESAVTVEQYRHIDVDNYSNYQVSMNVHSGTHLDTPLHFLPRPGFVADFPIDRFAGNAVVFDGSKADPIVRTTQMEQRISAGDIVLFRTGFDRYWGSERYFTDYPVIDEGLVDYLVERQIKIIGVDSPSPDKPPYPAHRKFFEAGICILENLCGLAELVNRDRVELFAFPLKLDADSSPVRVVARIDGAKMPCRVVV